MRPYLRDLSCNNLVGVKWKDGIHQWRYSKMFVTEATLIGHDGLQTTKSSIWWQPIYAGVYATLFLFFLSCSPLEKYWKAWRIVMHWMAMLFWVRLLRANAQNRVSNSFEISYTLQSAKICNYPCHTLKYMFGLKETFGRHWL